MSGSFGADEAGWLRVPAPAKINRFLHVLGRDAQGYHRLQTLFQFLEWGDTLDLRPRADGQISLSGDLCGLSAEENLVVRAARLLRAHSGTRQGAEIRLHKRIPAGAGLGGGSSDAATTLLALNQLWGLGLSLSVLAELGLQLGADVPVFVRGQACFAEGRGERMTPVWPPEGPLCLALPAIHCSTAEVFAHALVHRGTAPITAADWPAALAAARNDCEAAAFACAPALAALAAQWRQHAPFRLTGTGSAMFATVPNRAKARTLRGLVAATAGRAIVASVSNTSPLYMAGLISGPLRQAESER